MNYEQMLRIKRISIIFSNMYLENIFGYDKIYILH